ncbi:MAG: coxM [Pedosphaera sp.]|nr:coxM [Pedosphaera sp.]
MNEKMSQLLNLPVLASKHGADVDKLIIYVHYLMIVLFIGWILYFLYALLRFRKAANPKADYVGIRGHLSNYIELAVALVEGVLLVGFAVPLWGKAVDQFPKADEHPTEIRIIAQQFGWNVFYPGADGKFGARDLHLVSNENKWGLVKDDAAGKDDLPALYNEIHVPVDKPVIVTLTSMDVIHSFKIIAMRVTQDAIPGLAIPLHFTPTKTGIYQINCAQLCGNGHSTMASGRLYVDSQENYDKWLASKSKPGAGGATSFE